MVENLDNRPLADRAREAVQRLIAERHFENDRLPPEDELARTLSVSRTTIRTALHSLEQDGLITRRRALGTRVNRHVAPSMLALQRLVGFDGLLKEKGHKVVTELEWCRTAPPADIALAFGVALDADCLLSEKLYFADGAPALQVRDLVPWSTLNETPWTEMPPSLFEFSERHCKQPIEHAVVEIAAMANGVHTATRLAVPANEPFIRLLERHYTRTGEPAAYSVIDIDDDYIRFQVFRRQ